MCEAIERGNSRKLLIARDDYPGKRIQSVTFVPTIAQKMFRLKANVSVLTPSRMRLKAKEGCVRTGKISRSRYPKGVDRS